MHVCVVGMGYVGLPTALMLALGGHEVTGADINEGLIERLTAGGFHSPEPGLSDLYKTAMAAGHIQFVDRPVSADVYILALPTPVTSEGTADLSAIYHVVSEIRPFVKKGTLVVLESTVPPGTTEHLRTLVGKPQVLCAHVPERVLPGNLVNELVQNGRIVGGLSEAATEATVRLYRSFVQGEISITDARTAEMAKLMENTYRDVNIALANEFARVGHRLGISVRTAIALANKHPRVNILQPGLGVGGHCIAVDPWFIVEKAPEEAALIRQARIVNDSQPIFVSDVLTERLDRPLLGCRVAVLGLAYKGDVNDSRESPSEVLLNRLESLGAVVRVNDPLIAEWKVWRSEPLDELLPWADAIVVATGHSVYRNLGSNLIGMVRRNAVVVDAPGVLETRRWEELGLNVSVLGDTLVGINRDWFEGVREAEV